MEAAGPAGTEFESHYVPLTHDRHHYEVDETLVRLAQANPPRAVMRELLQDGGVSPREVDAILDGLGSALRRRLPTSWLAASRW